jgi:DNA polymerase-1
MKWATTELELLDNESRFTDLLFTCENIGIDVDARFLQVRLMDLLCEVIALRKEIDVLVGVQNFNPSSDQQVRAIFEGRYKVTPIEYTDGGKKGIKQSSWKSEVLKQISPILHGVDAAKLADLLIKLSEAEQDKALFCEGWLSRIDKTNRIHPNFKQHGTKTSRLSCSEPNAQNFPEWVLGAMVIPPGYVGVKWDLSQVEYRIFAHYANNDIITEAYKKNPDIDYHKLRADALGFPRKPIKPINFGVIYGMGQAKTKRSIIKALGEEGVDSPIFRTTATRYSGGLIVPEYPLPIPPDVAQAIGNNVLEEYHSTLPEIKQLMKKVKEALQIRGFVRNFFGRQYRIPVELSYIGLNAIIQGGAADLFKQILVEIHTRRCPEALMIDNIHDSDFAIMPIEYAQFYVEQVAAIMDECPFRIPITCDFELATDKWSNLIKLPKVNNHFDVKGTFDELLHKAK